MNELTCRGVEGYPRYDISELASARWLSDSRQAS